MKVLNFGSLNIDYVYEVDHFVRAKETIDSLQMNVFCGGKGLNQSIALSKSGAVVWHAGAVGENDSDMLLEQLSSAGVKTEFVKKKPSSSGHAIIQKDSNGQNSILLYGGANQLISKTDIDETLQHFEKGDYLILQNEINEIPYIMEQTHKIGMKIVFNPSPMNKKVMGYPLNLVDYFMLNEVEALEICHMWAGKDELMKAEQVSLPADSEWNDEVIQDIINKLGAFFPQARIVLTLGEKGSIYKDQDRILHQSIYKVKAVDTTAAGDTFTGYFIGGLIRGEEVEKALDNASKASAIAVMRLGAGTSIPSRDEIKAM